MANGNFAGGNGTASNPYLIEDAFDLNAVRNNLKAHYKLIKNIDLNISPFNEDEGWTPIGNASASFNGLFDGDRYIINNLYINRPNVDFQALFGYANNGTIEKIKLKNVEIIGNTHVAGIVGLSANSTMVRECYVTGTVSGNGSRVAGLVGDNMSSSIYNCGSLCSVSGTKEFVGGLVGINHTSSNIVNSYSAGFVTGGLNIGGLVGSHQSSSIRNSFWDIETSGRTTSAGGTGLTTQQMQTAQMFIDSGWDEDIWFLKDGQYPSFDFLIYNILITLNNQNYHYIQNAWQPVDSTEQDYLDYGMSPEYLSFIPSSAWQELSNPTISYYTDDPNKTQVLIETETEPFSIYDEMGDSMEVLYYTDDESKEEAELHIEANYSPLDELNDFEVVTWMDDSEGELKLNLEGLPKPQFIYQTTPQTIRGYLQGLIVEEPEEDGVVRYLLSPDKTTWKTWDGSKYVNVDVTDNNQIIKYGLTKEKIQEITIPQWETWQGDQVYIGVYLEEDVRDIDKAHVDSISIRDLAPTESTKVSDAKLYILNTISTINVSFAGSTLTGDIDDADEGKVQYRILLNGQPYFPADGSFTPLMASPLNIDTTLSNDDILIDENNNLRIEFQDYWGSTDYWETNFVGTYSGLLFLDETGEYYSTDIGEILKYLDFGVIIAGQTTLEHKVILRNTYGYTVKDINISANQSAFPEGMRAQFGTNDTTFEALDELNFTQELEDGEEIPFFIRLTTELGVTPQAQGEFDIVVKADKADT